MTLGQRLRGTAAVFSPGRRRWVRFLRSLPLDPDRLPRPVQSPTADDFVICGSPRSGTTLACAMLFQPPRVMTVMEPWDGMRLPPGELFASLREEIATTGGLMRGRLDVEMLEKDGEVSWCQEGRRSWPVRLVPGYLLGVKWPAYWRYLELLPTTKFVLCVRHPYETISSYKAAGGRLGSGLNYDTLFNRQMNQTLLRATRNEVIRRIMLFDYVHERMLPYLHRPNVFVLKYERWFAERAELMGELGRFLGVELGVGFPRLRAPRSRDALSSTEKAAVRRFSTTATSLGYALE